MQNTDYSEEIDTISQFYKKTKQTCKNNNNKMNDYDNGVFKTPEVSSVAFG